MRTWMYPTLLLLLTACGGVEEAPTDDPTAPEAAEVLAQLDVMPVDGACDHIPSESNVLGQINGLRADEGLTPLTCDPHLARLARAHAADMCARGFFGHVNPEGESPVERADRLGVVHHRLAENVASGQPSADSVVVDWMDSPSHRRNILTDGLTRSGVGRVRCGDDYEHYWVQIFAN